MIRWMVVVVVLGILISPSGAQEQIWSLVINELMASNGGCCPDPQGDFDDWIEIYNPGRRAVDLGGFYLTDDLDEPTKWQFPTDALELTTLSPGAYLVVWADNDPDPGLHANFKLSSNGEEIALVAPDGHTLIDSIRYPTQDNQQSYGRSGMAAGDWLYLAHPTPGQANDGGYLGIVAAPSVSPERGFYDRRVDVTLTSDTPGATLYYTVDGSDPLLADHTPSPTAQLYSSPIAIGQTTCLRAAAVAPEYRPSALVTHTYMLYANDAIRSLPVISLVGDEGETFYEPNGVMAVVPGRNSFLLRGYEKPVSFEWLDPNGETVFQKDCGLRVHGSSWMRPRYVRQDGVWSGSGKISFRLYFRDEYGSDWLEEPLFPQGAERHKTIVLRGGHNDRTNPFIKDELVRRMLADMGHASSLGTYATLFINGQLKGYYNPCEHINESFCRDRFDSTEDFDIIEMRGEMREGDRNRWNTLMSLVQRDLTDPDNYAAVAEHVDLVAFIDYLVLRVWSGDWDWPQNNWSAASERSMAGRWRFFVWDAEGSMFDNRLHQVRFAELHTNLNAGNGNSMLYHNLSRNPDFRRLFGDRVFKHLYHDGVITAGHIEPRFMSMRDQMQPMIRYLTNRDVDLYVVNQWVPRRHDIFLEACQREGVFTFAGPTVRVNDQAPTQEAAPNHAQLTLTDETGSGRIVYTVNGSDPAMDVPLEYFDFQTILGPEAEKRIDLPTQPVSTQWREDPDFRDIRWYLAQGLPGGVGYDQRGTFASLISRDVEAHMVNQTPSCLVRIPFTVSEDPTDFRIMRLYVQFDDGFVAYLNGVEVARQHAEGEPAWDSLATETIGGRGRPSFEAFDISAYLSHLQAGQNLLAIHGLNATTDSTDFLINATLEVGTLSPEAPALPVETYTGPLTLTHSLLLKARTKQDDQWSALTERLISVGPVRESLRISELMYHPQDPNTEYVELLNIGAEPINLNLVRFSDGIRFTFPILELQPGDLTVVVEDREAFENRFGSFAHIAGEYEGSLNNAGERIALIDAAGQTIQAFTYSDDWYAITDGQGHALIASNPHLSDADLSSRNAWHANLPNPGTSSP